MEEHDKLKTKEKPYKMTHFPLEMLDIVEYGENKIEFHIRNNSQRDLIMDLLYLTPYSIIIKKIAKNDSKQRFSFVLMANTITDVVVVIEGNIKGIWPARFDFMCEGYRDTFEILVRVLDVKGDDSK